MTPFLSFEQFQEISLVKHTFCPVWNWQNSFSFPLPQFCVVLILAAIWVADQSRSMDCLCHTLCVCVFVCALVTTCCLSSTLISVLEWKEIPGLWTHGFARRVALGCISSRRITLFPALTFVQARVGFGSLSKVFTQACLECFLIKFSPSKALPSYKHGHLGWKEWFSLPFLYFDLVHSSPKPQEFYHDIGTVSRSVVHA